MTRVALYTRVSTDRQEAENQRRQLRAFVKGNEGWKLVEEYRDEESGATGSRAYRTTRGAGKPGEDSAIGSRESWNGESTNRGEARWPPAFGR